MVAISLYRGNLHKVPDVPRRWLMPKHSISLKDFKSLTRKRDKTLSRLSQPTTSNPNPNPNSQPKEEIQPTTTAESPLAQPQPQSQGGNSSKENREVVSTSAKDLPNELGDDSLQEKPREVDRCSPSPEIKPVVPESVCNGGGGGTSEALQKELPTVELSENVESLREKKRRELEEKLTILNGKKHNLVQMLKQILNAEEELKRRNNVQAPAARPPVPLQGEATVDLGSSPRQTATRVGSDANCNGDLEGESEDASNHNSHTRHFHRMRSTSPSASSPLRKAAHNVVPYTTRTASPSRFAPTGSQGHPANLPPPVSLSGTQLIASSPSPAASGGTSVFRDTRLTSPSWN